METTLRPNPISASSGSGKIRAKLLRRGPSYNIDLQGFFYCQDKEGPNRRRRKKENCNSQIRREKDGGCPKRTIRLFKFG
jgi:hypothetical protein